jgi:hypothetical protein
MKKVSRIKKSRDRWKEKASARASEIRERRKSEKRLKTKIQELKAELKGLKNSSESPKPPQTSSKNSQIIELREASDTRALSVLLIVSTMISFRAVPKILNILPFESWIPHFTSVLNWTLRVGLELLNRAEEVAYPWIAIIDYSLAIGRNKVLVVLRVPLTKLKEKGKAIALTDCECAGLRIHQKVNGEVVSAALESIFKQTGDPVAILKDRGSDLSRGVSLWKENNHKRNIPTIDDISHVVANALKKEFEDTEPFRKFKEMINVGASRMRQTALGYLVPPKLRSKGRFQGISRVTSWATKILEIFNSEKSMEDDSLLERLRATMPEFLSLESFIEKFAKTIESVNSVLKLLKNQGLSEQTYQLTRDLLSKIPGVEVKEAIVEWLTQQIAIQRILGNGEDISLLVSSDIIESLFGKFKYAMERYPSLEINRSILLIPSLCGNLERDSIDQLLRDSQHKELLQWEEKNVPDTLRKKRQKLNQNPQPRGQKTGEFIAAIG